MDGLKRFPSSSLRRSDCIGGGNFSPTAEADNAEAVVGVVVDQAEHVWRQPNHDWIAWQQVCRKQRIIASVGSSSVVRGKLGEERNRMFTPEC